MDIRLNLKKPNFDANLLCNDRIILMISDFYSRACGMAFSGLWRWHKYLIPGDVNTSKITFYETQVKQAIEEFAHLEKYQGMKIENISYEGKAPLEIVENYLLCKKPLILGTRIIYGLSDNKDIVVLNVHTGKNENISIDEIYHKRSEIRTISVIGNESQEIDWQSIIKSQVYYILGQNGNYKEIDGMIYLSEYMERYYSDKMYLDENKNILFFDSIEKILKYACRTRRAYSLFLNFITEFTGNQSLSGTSEYFLNLLGQWSMAFALFYKYHYTYAYDIIPRLADLIRQTAEMEEKIANILFNICNNNNEKEFGRVPGLLVENWLR